ncbi:uncharacterized protein [Mytilus edulis]|uniref:uncharacterized protein n=1 Tax=Mytilus edulis TaxID=6550 RepID=UPI0039EE9900
MDASPVNLTNNIKHNDNGELFRCFDNVCICFAWCIYVHTVEQRFQIKHELLQHGIELKKVKEELESTTKSLAQVKVELESTRNALNASRDEITEIKKENSGETYIRWGKTSCPEESYLVYDGYAAGKHNDIGGSGSNLLCLSKNPEWKDYTEEYNPWTGKIYGIEYEILQNKPYPKTFHDKNVPCAVCQSKRATVLIVLGKVTCHCGWHKEFSGYVMSQLNLNGLTPSEYICVDEKLESVPGGDANQNEAVVYPVVAVCGSLKCPPYVNGVELTCVVCSK